MSMSHAPTNPKTLLQQNPLLSDDAEVLKNSSVVSSPVKPVIHDRSGATGVVVKKTSK